MKNTTQKGLQAVQYAFFWALGGLLLYLAFREQSLHAIWQTLQQASWEWPLVILGISVLNHISRVLRWRLMLAPVGKTPGVFNAFASLMFGYFVNLAVPRLGELSRCTALHKTEGLLFKPTLGTVITERAIDIACLGLVTLLAFVVESDLLLAFYMKEVYPHLLALFQQKSLGIRIAGIVGVTGFSLLLAYFLLRWKHIRRRSIWGRKAWRFSVEVWQGVASISKMERPWAFIGHTAFIWYTYFLMTYLWFFCFEATSGLSLGAGLAMLVIGSFARSLPIQGGGIGAYHYLFAQGIALYGIGAVQGNALAIMIHGMQLLYFLLIGAASMLWLLSRTNFHTQAAESASAQTP